MKIIRKLLHILAGSCILIVLIFFYDNWNNSLAIFLGIVAIIGLIIDLFRMLFSNFNNLLIKKLLPFVFTTKEEEGINSATLFFFSSSISILFFSQNISIVAIAILTYADSFASIIGNKFGKIKIGNKTLEGTLTFFVITFIISIIFFPLWISIILTVVISIIELISINIDDNFTIPLVSGLILTILGNLL